VEDVAITDLTTNLRGASVLELQLHMFTLDGMNENDPFLNLNNSGATNLLLGQNDVEEATVVSNSYSGEYGGLAGANVNYVTKTGSNAWHGSAIHWWNGRTMNANNFFNNQTGTPRAFDKKKRRLKGRGTGDGRLSNCHRISARKQNGQTAHAPKHGGVEIENRP
jgi:hypothetical protein